MKNIWYYYRYLKLTLELWGGDWHEEKIDLKTAHKVSKIVWLK